MCVAAFFLPLLYLTFELPKIIINDAISMDASTFPRTVLSYELDQVTYLLMLCFVFLALVLASFGTLYHSSIYKGVLSETLLRRLRYDLYQRILRFPVSHFSKVNPGEIVTMTTAEVEPIGRYMGIAFVDPALNAGTMVTAMVFLFAQDWMLGLAAIAFFPVQTFIIPKLQVKLNAVGRQRVVTVRKFAGQVSETLQGVREIHAHDTSVFELSRASERLGELFRIRREMYQRENFIKLVNAFLTQITPFLFYAIGGWMVIMADLSLGALVAVIGAYKETVRPWTKLIENYQKLEENKVKYQALVENFTVEGATNRAEPMSTDDAKIQLKGMLSVSDVSVHDGDARLLEEVSFESQFPGHIAVVGPAGSGKLELAELFCHLRHPSAGGIRFGDLSWSDLGESEIGRVVGYVGQDAHIFTGTWRDNLYYGLKHRPITAPTYEGAAMKEREKWIAEAEAAGNVSHDLTAEWVDFDALGLSGADALERAAIDVVKQLGLEDDLLQRGVQQLVRPEEEPELAEKILEARHLFAERLAASDFAEAAELFVEDAYNSNATLSENFLFGRHRDETFDVYHLGLNDHVLSILKEIGLYDCLLDVGRRATMHMLDMFGDMQLDDQRINRLSLIGSADLAKYESLIWKINNEGMHTLFDVENNMLLSIAFMLAPAHQRFGLIDVNVQKLVIQARKRFLAELPEELRPKLEVFSKTSVCGGITVQYNLLYGRIAQKRHRSKVNALMAEVVAEVGLCDDIIRLGLDSDVGETGGRLTPGQRQKLAVARCLIKKTDLVIINEALSALDAEEQLRLRRNVMKATEGRALIWIDREDQDMTGFDQVIVMKAGRIAEQRLGDGATIQMSADATAESVDGDSIDEINILRSAPLLAGLPPQILKLVAYSSERHEFEPGDVVFNAGDKSNGAYIVLAGGLEVSVDAGGSKLVVGSVKVGDIVGEVGVLANVHRTATVSAETKASVLLLTRDVFTDLIDKDKGVNKKVIDLLSERLAHATIELEKTRQG
jgi:ABC-type multidrug transport system fused ATPase/permease subunit